jgi:uncharacterized UPF0160 family protein
MTWLKSKKTVAVHSGNFHADDIFSVALLSLYLKEKVKIIRTRDEAVYGQADYVFDIGQVYEPEHKRFDHHQTGGAGNRVNGIPYATFGLLWKEYGESLTGSKEASDMIDKKLVAPTDADDNAVDICADFTYGVRPYTVSDYIVYRNSICEEKDRQIVFEELVEWAKNIVQMEIKVANKFLIDREKIVTVYNSTTDKRLIILDEDYEEVQVLADYPEPLFVVRPAPAISAWKVYAVKVKGEKFKNRIDLPVAWGSKRGVEFAQVTGVADALYCHHQLYMAIAKSKEGAIKLAQIALEK